jgi:dihydroorotate dehydrogenase
MKLRGINFGHVLDASGARGWFGEGHSFHRWVPFGLSFEGSTFVAKTTTLNPRRGNALVGPDGLTPRTFGQRSVKVNWRKGVVLNAFGLPGPGLKALLDTGRWQRLKTPFFISFMAIERLPKDSLQEVRDFVRMLTGALPNFSPRIGLQVNFSCPNVHAGEHLAAFRQHLDEYQTLGIPIMPKLSAALSVDAALAIAEHPGCDAICVSNSIAWGERPDRIDWAGLFGNESPLKEFGGGGLSGRPLLTLVADWVRTARAQGLRKPVNAGGGILKPSDVDVLTESGASSVFVGSIAILRGWRLQRTIRHANRIFTGLAAPEDVSSIPAVRRA